MQTYEQSVERVIFSAAEIAERIEHLAQRIASDYRGQPLVLLGVLKGALLVTADLARALARQKPGPSELYVEYLCVSSYGNATRSSGEVRLLKDASEPITGRHALIVEDIIDNGLTIAYLRELLAPRSPLSLRSCVLFDKPYRRTVDVSAEYVGFVAPDEFVVGYGLDYQELYRNLPYLAQLRQSVFS